MDLDVLAVQEVEDSDTLRQFDRDDLGGLYKSVVLIEGNDPRLIDVGLLSKLPLGGVTSWQHVPDPLNPDQPVFSRDFLQVEILKPDRSGAAAHRVQQPPEEPLRALHGRSGCGGREGERAAAAPVRRGGDDHRRADAAGQRLRRRRRHERSTGLTVPCAARDVVEAEAEVRPRRREGVATGPRRRKRPARSSTGGPRSAATAATTTRPG